MIRKAELKDIPDVIKLVKEFFEESLSDYGISLDLETLNETIQNFINNNIVIVDEEENKISGVIGGIVSQSIFDKSQKIAQEVIWYITQEKRKGLLGLMLIRAFEEECIKRGANSLVMICMNNLNPEILDRLYKINGFRMIENYYIKNIKGE